MKNTLFLGLGIVGGVLLVFLGWKLFSPQYQFRGSLIEPPVKAPDFSLVSQNEKDWRLSEQKNKTIVIFFGYTSCPDVCPLTLSKFKQLKELLGKDADEIEFVYITVDPERDSPEKMKRHLDAFDEEFVGLTGTTELMEPVWKDYGVYRLKVETESATGYLMDHSATTYVINSNGELRLTFPYGMDVEEMSADLSEVVKEGKRD